MKRLFLLLLLINITGCSYVFNRYDEIKMVLPQVKPAEVTTFDGEKTAPIAFQKAVSKIKSGTIIALQPEGMYLMEFFGRDCNKDYHTQQIVWDGGKSNLVGWSEDIKQIFFDTMKKSGFNVKGDPSDTFASEKQRMAANLLVAAELMEIKGNICREYLGVAKEPWKPTNLYAGELYVDVNWVVYDRATEQLVGSFRTVGYFENKNLVVNGVTSIFNNAFEEAAKRLAGDEGFRALVSGADAEASRQKSITQFDKQTIQGVVKSNKPIGEITTGLNRSTVTLRSGGGHGSGFIISKDGYILTAAHVVGDAKKMTAKFDNGLELPAVVVRANAYRDAALLKVEVNGLTPVALESASLPKPLDEVYAIGSPLLENLNTTITRGIVSALREDEQKKGLLFIQSDVAIQGGNSGGPLLDKTGNVIGIAVSGFGSLNAGLNFFAPIADCLKYLNIEVTQGETAR